ncbi:MAG TPA: VWA domain-containing protein [Gemmatimonadaceae bacterium]
MSAWFEYPLLLPLAFILPVLAWVMLRMGSRRRAKRLERLGERAMVERLVPAHTLDTGGWRLARLVPAAALIGVAVAGPRWGYERSIVRASGVDMVLALDASLSMMARDEKPSRLERMKEEVRRLRAMSPGDRVGMLAFAGRSYVLSPMTVDAGALDLFLDNLDPSVVGQAGSSLARTIRQGTDLLLLASGEADKALVVMTDGEAFEEVADIVAEAKRAGEKGVSLVVVGFGTPQGATIPVEEDGRVSEKKDEGGQVVVTRYHPEVLQAVAQAAGGTFIPAEANDKAARIKGALSRLRGVQRASAAGETRSPRFQLFLLPAVLLLLVDTILADRRGRRPRRGSALAHTSLERGAAAILVTLSLGLSSCARNNDGARGAEAYRAKRYAEAAAAYRRAIAAGDSTAATTYNLGTALLAADSAAPSAELLERTAGAKDPEVRHRALFNLGLLHLVRGLAGKEKDADPDLDAALAAYKQVLLRRPNDQDAKWNYELALRKKQEGGGGGGGGGGSSAEQTPQPEKEQQQQANGLAQQQAEQLLGSAARDEKDVQAKRQKQNRVEPPPGGKDW